MKLIRKPLLLILALIIILVMIRLGFWQLGRADEKQAILDQQVEQANSKPSTIDTLLDVGGFTADLRFKHVELEGQYDASRSILIDNQVLDSKVGYLVFTAMQVKDSNSWVLVNRGWLSVGESRSVLPSFSTRREVHKVIGRLNFAPARPPMLSADFALPEGPVWPYLPIAEAAQKMKISLLPMVIELSPEFQGEVDSNLQRRWREINDRWVATHHGYAFQWFAMALAFLVACVILLIRSERSKS